MRPVTIGLLGCGTVGGGLVRLLDMERERIRARLGLDIRIGSVLVRDPARSREGVPPGIVTGAPLDVVDGDCDVVVEVMGGTHTAGALVRRAIERGRDVVTANKALLAASGHELARAAEVAGVGLGIEASVCGGIPVIRMLRDGLAGDSVESILGILNGTSNYILSRMAEGMDLAAAVARAQELGFAESDPSIDLTGEDALQKATVLARLAFDEPIRVVERLGIDRETAASVRRAVRRGRVVRQVAEVRRVPGGISVSAGLRMLLPGHPLAGVFDEQNGVLITARAAGELFLSGRGAGSLPTASAVLSDVIAVVRERRIRVAA